MGYVYGYRNNNPAEGYVKCPFTGRKNCIKYKTGKARNYHKRLGKEFKETRAEFVPNPQDITVYKTNDATGTKAENKIHAIYFLPCEMKDRKFDVNLNIENSLLSINRWFRIPRW